MTLAAPVASFAEQLASLIADPNFSGRVLTISTSHMTPATDLALRDQDDPLCENANFRDETYGWSFHTADDEQEKVIAEFDGQHAELLALLTFARTAGYQRLHFDADADTLPAAFGFPVFEW